MKWLTPSFWLSLASGRPNLQKIAANTGWLFLDKILRMGVGLLVGVWVARYLQPARFGLLSYAGAVVALFSAVASLGLDGIVVREIVKYPEREKEILGSTLFLKFVGGILTLVVAVAAVAMLRGGDPQLVRLVAVVAAGTVFQAFDAIDFWFQSKVLSRYTVYARNTAFLLVSLFKVGLICLGAPLIMFAWAGFLEIVLSAIGLVVAYRANGGHLREWRIRISGCRLLLRDSWPLILGGLSVMIYMKIDQVMLGEMAGNAAVGIYSAATRISEVWYFIPTAIVSSVFPAILQAKQEDEGFYQRRLQRLFSLMVALALAISVPMTFLSGPLVALLFGTGYASAGPVLAVHIWASVFVFLGVAQGTWDLAENLTRLALLRASVGAVLNIVLNLMLIPAYGAYGAAVATVVSYAVTSYLLNACYRRTRPIFFSMTRSFLFFRYLR